MALKAVGVALERAAVCAAMGLRRSAAETGTLADREAATDQVALVLRDSRLA